MGIYWSCKTNNNLCLYGLVQWLKFKYQDKMLGALDRLACRAIATTFSTTPQAALNVIYDLTPLKLHTQQTALSAFVRLKDVLKPSWQPASTKIRTNTPHLWYLDNLITEFDIQIPKTDKCREVIRSRGFHINTDSFDGKRKHRRHAEYTIYTDGSKTKDGNGSGFVIFHNKNIIHEDSYRHPAWTTVFQSEIKAIQSACKYLNSSTNIYPKYIKILSDSQAAIQALANDDIRSTEVLETIYQLELLAAKAKRLTIAWVKAHVGTSGNEKADDLAKKGTSCTNFLQVAMPEGKVKNEVKNKTRVQWNKNWNARTDCKHTKFFFPNLSKSKSKAILKLSRTHVTRIIQIVTGHSLLSYFQSKLDCHISPTCRLCGNGNETFVHLVTECDTLWQTRRDLLDNDKLVEGEGEVNKILDFSQKDPLDTYLRNRDYLEEEPEYDLDANYSSNSSID